MFMGWTNNPATPTLSLHYQLPCPPLQHNENMTINLIKNHHYLLSVTVSINLIKSHHYLLSVTVGINLIKSHHRE